MSPVRVPPLAGGDQWQAVLAAAAGRCQCPGACGKSHAKDGGRCKAEHGAYRNHAGGTVRLMAAPAEPADLLLPPHRAAALPKRALAAWCPPCHDAARTTARKTHTTPAAEPNALFDSL